MLLVRNYMLGGLIFLSGIHFCATNVTIEMDENWGSGCKISLVLIPDTSFTGGFAVLIELNSPADLTVSFVFLGLTNVID